MQYKSHDKTLVNTP